MVAPNNALLYDAAISGMVAGSLKDRYLTKTNTGVPPLIGTADPSYAAIAAQCTAFATEVDSKLPTDSAGLPAGTQPISTAAQATTIAAGSDTQVLPQATIDVAATAGFAAAGVIFVTTDAGVQKVAYTGTAGGNSFTGCTGGLGEMHTGGAVTQAAGNAIIPSTGSIQMGQIGKMRLLESLALGIVEGRYYAQPTALTAAEMSAIATIIEDAYDLFAETYVQPYTSGAPNNQLLLFAVFNGALGGMLAGCPDVAFNNNNLGFLTAIAEAAGALAVAVDAAIPNDASISQAVGGGTHAVPAVPEPDATNIVQLDELAKYRLMHSIALAAVYDRSSISLDKQFNVDAPALADWATKVSGPIVAMYNASKASLTLALPAGATPLNPGLWNEAFCGFIAGNLAGRPFTSTLDTDANYLAVAAAAAAFATEVDATVAASDVVAAPIPAGTQAITVNVAEGIEATYIVPTTGQIQEGELGKSGLMWAICRGVNHGRPLLNAAADTVSATYLNISKSIVALYLELCTVLNTP